MYCFPVFRSIGDIDVLDADGGLGIGALRDVVPVRADGDGAHAIRFRASAGGLRLPGAQTISALPNGNPYP